MDARLVNPFLDAVTKVVPQFGFSSIVRKGVSVKSRHIQGKGVMLSLGITGDVEGSVLYNLSLSDAKGIASRMMCKRVNELDSIAESALSEFSNILTANVSMNFSELKLKTDITPPQPMNGTDMVATLSSDKVLCVEYDIDDISLELNISLE